MDYKRKEFLEQFMKNIDYQFKNIDLLNLSLTHSSYANEHKNLKNKFNERLEFLGDSVLDLAVAEYLYKSLQNCPEGDLTKIRATLVCEPSLSAFARHINLGVYIMLGKGELQTGGRNRTSILADAFEAIIGAIYLDGGIEASKKFIIDQMKSTLDDFVKGKLVLDYKTKFQEEIQAKYLNKKIKYIVKKEEGPDHNKTFFVEAVLDEVIHGKGVGKTKKEAEQNAARDALVGMEII